MNIPAPLLFMAAASAFLPVIAAADDFRLFPNIAYVQNGKESQTGDLYLPEKDGPPTPAVIVIHGGGWSQGSNQDNATIEISEALARHGYVAFDINYRLVGQGGEYPADVQDVKDATAWLVTNAEKYHIDPARIAMVGQSAGGHLALLAAYSANVPPLNAVHYPGVPIHIAAVAAYYAPTSFLFGAESNSVVASYLQLNPDKPDKDKLTASSPMSYVATAVPTLLLHGDADTTVPVLASRYLATALTQQGIKSELTIFPGAGHAFDHASGPNRDAAISDVLEFLGEQLGAKQAVSSQPK